MDGDHIVHNSGTVHRCALHVCMSDGLSVTLLGKMVLLDKLLPRLQRGGHRVLIFSQVPQLFKL